MQVDQNRAPVIVVASVHGRTADEVASRLRRDGAIAVAAHSAQGCLRVATSIGPDIVVLDSDLPRRLEKLLRAHPVSARAQVVQMHGSAIPLGVPAAALQAI
jgi:DNA-binding response OmpR family regulator